MIEYELQPRGKYRKLRTARIFNLWDVKPENIVHPKDVTEDDVGKMLLFDDGSDWLSPILSVTELSIRTEICVLRREDYVHRSNIHGLGVAYSGVPRTEEHELVRPFTHYEKSIVKSITEKGFMPRRWTERLKMLTLEVLSEKLKANGIDENWFANRLYTEAVNPNGSIGDRLKVLQVIAKAMGIALSDGTKDTGPRGGIFIGVNNTIQSERRANLPKPKEMDEIVTTVVDTPDKFLEELKAKSNDRFIRS